MAAEVSPSPTGDTVDHCSDGLHHANSTSAAGGWSSDINTANPHLLGFPPHSTSINNRLPSSTSGDGAHRLPPDGHSMLLGGNYRNAANPDLGLQPLQSYSTTLGKFPKVSSNYDKIDDSSRQQQSANYQQPSNQTRDTPSTVPPLTKERSPEQVSQPPPRKNVADVSADTSRAPKLTFAEAAARRAARPPDLFVHNLQAIKPVKMNEEIAVIIPSDMYEIRLNSFQFALIGRLILPQGSAPRGGEDLKRELTSRFGTTSNWVLMPLGKGYFSLKFNTVEDKIKASRLTSWKLSAGSLQTREWKPNFNPYKELSSTAQIWVRLFHLPVEYWHPEFLVGIFRAVGNVIKLDGNTAQGLVGHFARALVEIDLNQPIIDTIRVGLPDNLLSVDFSYENIPTLCSFCNFVGHTADRCRKAKAKEDKEDSHNLHQQVVPKQRWVEKPKAAKAKPSNLGKQQEGVATSNPFGALHEAEDFVPESATHANAASQDHDLNKNNGSAAVDGECHTDEEMSTDDDKEFVGETQFQSPTDLMDLVTISVDDATTIPANISEDAKRRLIAKVKQTARRRQLRSELKAKSGFAKGGTSTQALGTADPQQHAHNSKNHEEAAVASDLRTNEEVDDPSSSAPGTTDPQQQAHNAAVASDLRTSEVLDDIQASSFAAVPTDVPAAVEDPSPPATVPAGKEAQADTTLAQLDKKMVDSPPAQVKGVAKRAKNKRKVVEVLPKRQLRSSTKNRSISEITPEMIQAYANNQCHYVPTDSLGQPKAKQVAPNSPHPTRALLEEKLRTAAELGRHTTAYVLDTGQTDTLKSMDFITKQQWDAIPNTEAHTGSDFNSD